MKKIVVICKPVVISLTSLTFFLNTACTSEQTATLPDENYKIVTSDYIVLAEKSLDLWASDEFESFASILSEEVEYEFPDGKKISGKIALIDYLKNYKKESGIKSMKIEDTNYLPVDIHLKPKGNENPGIKVVADFTNKVSFTTKDLSIKMHFNLHFSKTKMIDRIMTYYDQTTIIKASYKEPIQKLSNI